MHVIESDFAMGGVKGGIELPNGFTVRGAVGEVDLAVTVRIGKGSGSLHEQIGFAGNGIVVSGKSRDCGEIDAEEVGSKSESAVTGEVPVLESSRGVEFGGGIVAAQNRVAEGDGMEGKLDGGGKRIPMRLEWMGAGCGGQGDIEIVDFQIAGKLRSGE